MNAKRSKRRQGGRGGGLQRTLLRPILQMGCDWRAASDKSLKYVVQACSVAPVLWHVLLVLYLLSLLIFTLLYFTLLLLYFTYCLYLILHVLHAWKCVLVHLSLTSGTITCVIICIICTSCTVLLYAMACTAKQQHDRLVVNILNTVKPCTVYFMYHALHVLCTSYNVYFIYYVLYILCISYIIVLHVLCTSCTALVLPFADDDLELLCTVTNTDWPDIEYHSEYQYEYQCEYQ